MKVNPWVHRFAANKNKSKTSNREGGRPGPLGARNRRCAGRAGQPAEKAIKSKGSFVAGAGAGKVIWWAGVYPQHISRGRRPADLHARTCASAARCEREQSGERRGHNEGGRQARRAITHWTVAELREMRRRLRSLPCAESADDMRRETYRLANIDRSSVITIPSLFF